MTGVKTRGQWPVGTNPSFIAAEAGKKLLQNHAIDPQEIDMLIFASVCRDCLEPATASMVHAKLELGAHCISFDLSNACLGMVDAMNMAAQLVESGHKKNVLIVSGENGAPLLEQTIKELNEKKDLSRKGIKKYLASLTIGSAGAALLISSDQDASSGEILNMMSYNASEFNHLCRGGGNTQELTMETESEKLLIAGVETAKKLSDLYTQNIKGKFSKIISHQVGIRHREILFEKLGLNPEMDYSVFERFGNTGSTAIFLALSEAVKNKFIQKGDEILGLGIGSGLNACIFQLRWLV
jgi:3-oxoacyl-[acyl-carrier-protein] synthase-3